MDPLARGREPGADNRKHPKQSRAIRPPRFTRPESSSRFSVWCDSLSLASSTPAVVPSPSLPASFDAMRFVNVALKKRAEAQQDLDACDQKSRSKHDDTRLLQRPSSLIFRFAPLQPDMPSPVASSPTKSPLSVQRPTLSPRKRRFSDASVEAASPTSLDEVDATTTSEDRVISPKKKAKAEERSTGDLSKWESHVVASIASALDLDCMTDDDKDSSALEPIAFSAAPAGDLTADELEMLHHFLA